MTYLLDTHIVMWALIDHPNLPKVIRELILDEKNTIYYSTVSIWETEIKHLKYPKRIMISGTQLSDLCDQAGILNLEVRNAHVSELKNVMPIDSSVKHNDPFDRMLLAQARSEGMILISHDHKFDYYSDPHLLVY